MEKKKFNINNYFNAKLFLEALKQIRIVALIFFVCLSVAAIFVPIMIKSDYYNIYEITNAEILLNIKDCMYPLLSLVFIATPIMYIVLFSFQTKRSASDFYHSLPVKRSCQFLSYIAAIFAWVLTISITYIVILIISANMTSSYFIINYSIIFNQFINLLICNAVIIGVFSIGTSLTGTLTSNIISSFGILLVPRFIIMALVELVTDHSMTLTYDSECFIFNNTCNIVFAQLLDIISFENDGALINVISKYSLYSLVLAIVYIAIGLKLFTTRPSEIASKSFRNKKIFFALKCGAGFFISLILVYDIYDAAINLDFSKIAEHSLQYTLVIIAIGLSMFALEAAFTKSIKSGLKTILITPFILILDVIIIFSASQLANHFDNERINPDNVDYVCVEYDYYYYFTHISETDVDYFTGYYSFETLLQNAKLTDQKIIDYLLSIYNSDRVQKAKDMPYHGYRELYVTFDSTLGEKTRCLYLTEAEYKSLATMLFDNKTIQKCMATYPENDQIALRCMDESLSSKQTHALYDSLLKEVKSLYDNGKAVELFNTNSYASEYNTISGFYIEFYNNGEFWELEVPISSLTPETYILYMTYVNDANKNNVLDIINKLDDPNDTKRFYANADAVNLLPNGTSTMNFYYYHEDASANSVSSSFNPIKDYIKDYYLNNKTLNYNDIISGKYYVSCIYLMYDYNEYDFDNKKAITGCTYFLLPVDSPLVDDVLTYEEDEYGYEEEYRYEGEYKDDSEIVINSYYETN